MINLTKKLENNNDSIQKVRNKNNCLDLVLKLLLRAIISKLIRKYVRKNHNDCDNHSPLSNLINKNGVVLFSDFDSLTDGMFDELRFEILLKDLDFDENKDFTTKYVDNLDKYSTILGLKSLNRSFN